MTDPFTPSPELAAIARRWLENYASRRAEAATNLFSRSAALSYIGTDAGEVFGGEELRRVFATFTQSQATLVVEDLVAEGYEAGAFGWATAQFNVFQPEAEKRVALRSTFVYALEDGIWRIAHIHHSNPTPNIDAHGYESQNLQELAAAAQSDRLEIAQTGIASIMFTDIVDSTSLAEAMGDGAWSRIVKDHVAEIAQAVEAAGGTLVKSLGDGTLSSFPSAGGAMNAAAAIQRGAAASAAEPRLRLRVGVHTGDLVRTEGDFLGSVVNKAARIAAAAAPDEILVSEATRVMVGGAPGFVFEDPAHVLLKGLEGEHLVHRLRWHAPVEG